MNDEEKELEAFIAKGVDIYKLLDISPDAKDNEIRRAYRRKALVLHPDKNPSPEARELFREIGIVQSILTKSELRIKYDQSLESKRQKEQEERKLDGKYRDFRSSLLRREKEVVSAGKKASLRSQKIERLRDEALRLRQIKENELRSKTSTRAQPHQDHRTSMVLPKSVKLKWKNKLQLIDMITEDVIEKLMSVFGDVRRVSILRSTNRTKDNYHYAIVTFASFRSCVYCSLHDFSHTSNIWDSLGLRKLGSLLRSCKLWTEEGGSVEISELEDVKSLVDSRELGFDGYLGLTLLRLVNSYSNESK
ncbi:unnamed protein product [Kuraishia capsulata CBS 1993]|uniref:J domain-containing protein n=1 Tax=Kuraishia capsulata CBS 1993 TaxID=1382522 RepID=W6MP34_9ASCO|nr:uncharacterized protein KUCA_T00002811001 [Kuraishia capsulata CBS 1993]CDK26837.1 unnamed protein product [Kuraishia capsulata CBS 1993]